MKKKGEDVTSFPEHKEYLPGGDKTSDQESRDSVQMLGMVIVYAGVVVLLAVVLAWRLF